MALSELEKKVEILKEEINKPKKYPYLITGTIIGIIIFFLVKSFLIKTVLFKNSPVDDQIFALFIVFLFSTFISVCISFFIYVIITKTFEISEKDQIVHLTDKKSKARKDYYDSKSLLEMMKKKELEELEIRKHTLKITLEVLKEESL